MIERYSREEMRNIFSDENRFKAYLEVELYATEAWSTLGVVPKEDVEKLFANAKFDLPGILELEKETKHDIVAFTRNVSSYLGDEKKWVHYGLTSTDVVDTAYGYLYKQANDILYRDLLNFQEVLKEKAIEEAKKSAEKAKKALEEAKTPEDVEKSTTKGKEDVEKTPVTPEDKPKAVGKISGAVGTFSNTPPEVQDYVCAKLGIESSNISTQTLQRDRHADYYATLALIASSIEKIGVEIRHLQRTEVREAEEFFSKNQKGSSAMPHKRNPISSENMAGCARIMRGYMFAAYENIPLWHERDISHSSAERILSNDATTLLDYMLNRFTNVVKNLTVFTDNMIKNIYATNGVIFAQRTMSNLIEKYSFSREEAYDLVQPLAMKSWFEGIPFRELLEENETIKNTVSKEVLDSCFDLNVHLVNIDKIYKRIPGLED